MTGFSSMASTSQLYLALIKLAQEQRWYHWFAAIGRQMKDPIANTWNLPSNFTCSNCSCAPLLDLEEKLSFTLGKDVCLWNVLIGVFGWELNYQTHCTQLKWIQVPRGQCPDSQGYLFSVNTCWWKFHTKICLQRNIVLNLYWYIYLVK